MTNKENCRRHALLNAIGSSESPAASSPCCDICEGRVPDKLSFEVPVLATKKRRKVVRVVDEDLCSNLKRMLISTRDHFLDEHPHLKMIGPSFTCSSSIIDDICSNARFIDSIECIRSYAIHPELCPLIFATLSEVLTDAPPPRSRRRRIVT